MHYHHVRHADNAGDRRDIANEIEIELVILNLPLASRHSLTSSASASSVGGTSMASALAVLV
jgi:hypothetical protein